MKIRFAGRSDLKQLLHYDKYINEEELLQLIDRNRVLISELEDCMIGWLRYNLFWDHIPFMNMLYVLEHEQKKNYGRQLVVHWERQMKELGYHEVMTSTASDEYAQHFYVRIGYQVIGGFTLPNEPYELLLSKQI